MKGLDNCWMGVVDENFGFSLWRAKREEKLGFCVVRGHNKQRNWILLRVHNG